MVVGESFVVMLCLWFMMLREGTGKAIVIFCAKDFLSNIGRTCTSRGLETTNGTNWKHTISNPQKCVPLVHCTSTV